MSYYDSLKPDPTISVPVEISEAARKVEKYFEGKGATEWCLHGVCSRKLFEKAVDVINRAKFEASGLNYNPARWPW